jgi:Spy/CpxP family protein refolding chaperone
MKIIYLLLFICISSSALNAQNKRHEKIKAYKTAHITQELDLSTAEAEKFWPIYNAHEEKMRENRRTERKEILEQLRDGGIDNMTDAEANILIDKATELETSQIEERKNFIKQLREVISPKKIIKLRIAEEDFKKQLLERYRGRKNKGNHPK